jgi:signal transduction histidine kinase
MANDVLMAEVGRRERIENALRLSLQRLSDMDRNKNEFLAVLAHELRNPLAPIQNAVQLLRLQESGDPQRWAREVIDRQVRHMIRLVDDLLDLSRITRNTIHLRRERTDISTVVRTAVETSRPLIDTRDHRLNVAVPQGPIELDVDPARLAQVFSNLLNNAAKFTPPGGRIWFTIEREAADIVILDIGMPLMNGYDVAQRIREHDWGRRMVLVAMTGWGQDEDRQRTSEAGFAHHLTKPVDLQAVRKILASQ